MRTLSSLARRVGVPALALLITGSCSTQTFPTPSRNLDRPSDAALVCVEYEISPEGDKTCLPAEPRLSADDYLSQYCGNTGWRELTPRVKVLPLSECEDGNIRQRRDSFYADLRSAASAVGRDPNQPCCSDPVNNLYCDEQKAAPVCVRRTLMTLIANTVRGELAIGDTTGQVPGLTTVGRLQNLHGGTPGFGFLPVGLQPEHVRAHDSGMWAVTSNAGSCDLSLVAVDKIMPLTTRASICDDAGQSCPTRDCDGASCPQRIEPWLPTDPTNKLRSRPAWVEIAPWAGTMSQSAIVSYPTCGVVAVVNLVGMAGEAPGKVLEAVAFDQQDPTKPPRVLTPAELQALKCPLDCGGETGALAPDPMQLPAGGAMRASAYPISVAVDREGRRLLIGDALGDSITVVDYDPAAMPGSRLRPALRRIALDFEARSEALRGGQRGIDVLRVGPRTAAGLYAYAITRDSTVRIVDLDREVECETNPDPRFVQQQSAGPTGPLRLLPDEFNDSNLRRLSCLPVDKQKTPRNPLQVGPGIAMPNGSTPRDIGFVHLDAPACLSSNPDECPFTAPATAPDYFLRARSSLWIGDFAWILSGGGNVTALQIADACPQPSPRACFADYAAQKRGALLHTRSQEMPSPEQLNLPGLPMAMTVSPLDRLGNVRRLISRFDELTDTVPGPGTQSDSSTGLPVFTALVAGTQTSVQSLVPDSNRRRLSLPAPAPYYYLPVDPICDAALEPQADLSRVSASDAGLPKEPRRRPVAMASFVDPASIANEAWTLEWEGVLTGLQRATGRLASDGTLLDLNGLYCARGAEVNDKLWLPGCLSNSDCFQGTTCRRDAQGTAPGLCLTNDQEQECRKWSSGLISTGAGDTFVPDSSSGAASWLRRYRVVKAEQQIQATPGGDQLDRLTLDEIPEPEFEIERAACTKPFGATCDDPDQYLVAQQRDVQGADARILKSLSCRAVGGTMAQPEKSCIVSCETSKDCGAGFVCARSRYEDLEPAKDRAAGYKAGRCLRAPLIKEGTPWVNPDTRAFKKMDAAEASRVIAACFPDQTLYQVRAGDAFLVSGKLTGAPTVLRRNASGQCERPKPGDATYMASRLFQPRLRLGPHVSAPDTDPQRCPKAAAQWIHHRWLPAPEAAQAPSCQSLFANGIYRPQEVPAESIPKVVRGSDYLPASIAECQRLPMAPGCKPADPWLATEYELFGSLQLDAPSNQCLLTGEADETYPKAAPDCSSGFCLFPGDHTEMQGVRRIHFENAYGNLVMRVPRMSVTLPFVDPADPDKKVQQIPTVYWAVPPDGYLLSFTVLGGQRPYVQLAQTSQRDGLTDVLAQGLRSAVTAPSGVVYMVDEGRTGVVSHLRGRIIRMFGSAIDPYFILR